MNESIQLLIFQIWEVYKGRRCVRTYNGHKQAVKDIGFNNSGEKFLSCAYDRYCKLWDTETGLLMTFNPFAGDNILVYGIQTCQIYYYACSMKETFIKDFLVILKDSE